MSQLVFEVLRCYAADLSPILFSPRERWKNIGETIYIRAFWSIFSLSLNMVSLKSWTEVPILFVVPPLVHCCSSNIISLVKACSKVYNFLCGYGICFAWSHKSIGVWTRSFRNNIKVLYSGNIQYILFLQHFFQLYRAENYIEDRSTEEHLKNPKTLVRPSSIHFCQNIWILFGDPVPLKQHFTIMQQF